MLIHSLTWQCFTLWEYMPFSYISLELTSNNVILKWFQVFTHKKHQANKHINWWTQQDDDSHSFLTMVQCSLMMKRNIKVAYTEHNIEFVHKVISVCHCSTSHTLPLHEAWNTKLKLQSKEKCFEYNFTHRELQLWPIRHRSNGQSSDTTNLSQLYNKTRALFLSTYK